MSVITLMLVLALLGVITWAIVTYIPMPQGIRVGGENFEFDTKKSERSLICRKITKTPKKSEKTADIGESAETREPVAA